MKHHQIAGRKSVTHVIDRAPVRYGADFCARLFCILCQIHRWKGSDTTTQSKAAHRRKNRVKSQGSPSHKDREEDAMKKDEWLFFRTKNNRISYHKKCLGCVHDCKQSYRVKAIYCPRYKKRGRWPYAICIVTRWFRNTCRNKAGTFLGAQPAHRVRQCRSRNGFSDFGFRGHFPGGFQPLEPISENLLELQALLWGQKLTNRHYHQKEDKWIRINVTIQDTSSARVFRRKIPSYACKNSITAGDF